MLPQGFDDAWRPIHRAKKAIFAGELFTEENTIRRFVQISAEDATQDILMHTAMRSIRAGEIIHGSSISTDRWEYVYYAKKSIEKGNVIDSTNIQLRVVKAIDLDGEWNYADCSDTMEVFHAAKDIKYGAAIRCSDLE